VQVLGIGKQALEERKDIIHIRQPQNIYSSNETVSTHRSRANKMLSF